MSRPIIIVTGAAGFLGSALTADLGRDHSIVAIDRREPSAALLAAAPHVEWHRIDIAEREALAGIFDDTRRRHDRIDFVIHLAAFYHFDLDWHPEYERTNVGGTSNVVQRSIASGVGRLVFASSLLALCPPSPGKMLDERTPAADVIPYGKSKRINEQTIAAASDRLPSIVLRIGGVFSDWCELPPLYGLIRLWCGRSPVSRVVPGRGETGFPYVHRTDWVRLVRRCIARHRNIERHETLLACQHGAVSHGELFTALHGERKPIHVSPTLARIGLHARRALGRLTGAMPYERPWMLGFVDRPWIADTTRTRDLLGWDCSEGMRIVERLPVLLDRFEHDRPLWERRNRDRQEGRYSFSPD